MKKVEIYRLIKSHGLVLKKSMGQNFMVDPVILRQIVTHAEIKPGIPVLEIGAGIGSLTRYLAEEAERVIAVELDRRFIPILRQQLDHCKNVQIVHGDILRLPVTELAITPGYFVVANIPYNITSILIRHLLEQPVKPGRLVLTVQWEVAERICAVPGKMNLLALSVQVYGSANIVMQVPSSAFYPQPEVDSGVVRVDILTSPRIENGELEGLFTLARAGFSQKRKTLRNALAGSMHWSTQAATELLTTAKIDPMRRAESLCLEEWQALARTYITSGA